MCPRLCVCTVWMWMRVNERKDIATLATTRMCYVRCRVSDVMLMVMIPHHTRSEFTCLCIVAHWGVSPFRSLKHPQCDWIYIIIIRIITTTFVLLFADGFRKRFGIVVNGNAAIRYSQHPPMYLATWEWIDITTSSSSVYKNVLLLSHVASNSRHIRYYYVRLFGVVCGFIWTVYSS